MEDIFVSAVLTDKVKVKPSGLCRNKQSILLDILVRKFEGKCSYHGYIKRGSISIVKCSVGQVKDVSLNGDTEYAVSYNALVCNPVIGSIVRAKVVNQNKFGILAEVFINGTEPVLEIIITKMVEPGEVSLDNVKVGDMINVEILKKKFELGDEKITNVGRIIHSNARGGNISMIGGEYNDPDEISDADDGSIKELAFDEDEEDEEADEEDEASVDDEDDEEGASSVEKSDDEESGADVDAGWDVQSEGDDDGDSIKGLDDESGDDE